jgi:hypothetical protein
MAKKMELPEKIMSRLGQVPDMALAREAGVNTLTIRHRRLELGLKPAPWNSSVVRLKRMERGLDRASRVARMVVRYQSLKPVAEKLGITLARSSQLAHKGGARVKWVLEAP